MKKFLLLSLVLVSAFLFSACWPLDKNNADVELGSGSTTSKKEKEVVPQVGEPVGDNFKQALTEKASENGLTEADVQEVRKKLAETFKMDIAEVEITAEAESTLTFMTGYVNVGESDKGGVYFAAKTEAGWEIAYNGVGVVYCEPIEKYKFPVGMVPKCYDVTTGLSKDRQ